MVQMRIEGGEQLAKILRSLPDRVPQKVLRAALTESAQPMRERMEKDAPRDPAATDHLAENVAIAPISKYEDSGERVRVEATGAAVAVGPTTPFFYGLMLEFGTVKMRPRPFMRPAFDAEVGPALKRVTASIWNALTKAGIGRGSSPRGTGGL